MATSTNPAVPSPVVARCAGLFYVLTIVIGILALHIKTTLVSGDAASTVANILSHETSFRLAFVADSLMLVCYIVVTALLYALFRRVNNVVSLVATFFSLVACAVQAVALLLYTVPFLVLAALPSTFNTGQVHSMVLLLTRSYGHTYNICLSFFGFYCILIGFLSVRSCFVPKIVGALMVIAGLGWLTFLWPPLAGLLQPYNLLPGLVGEGVFALWLLIMGVHERNSRRRLMPNST